MFYSSLTIRDSVGGWCSGSTLDFDSSSTSSILVPPAKQKCTQRLNAQADVADYSFTFWWGWQVQFLWVYLKMVDWQRGLLRLFAKQKIVLSGS